MEKANIAVLGSGGFGLSLAVMMDKMGHDVTVWSKFKSEKNMELLFMDPVFKEAIWGGTKLSNPSMKVPDPITRL